MSELAFSTLTALAQQIRSRSISPVQVTQHLLDRIAQFDGQLHAYVTVLTEQALAQAAISEAEITACHCRGPLPDIPLALKDLFFSKVIPTHYG